MSRLFREFEPFKNLWSSTAEWRNNQDTWMNNSLLDINPEELEQKVMFYFKTIHRCTKTFKVHIYSQFSTNTNACAVCLLGY